MYVYGRLAKCDWANHYPSRVVFVDTTPEWTPELTSLRNFTRENKAWLINIHIINGCVQWYSVSKFSRIGSHSRNSWKLAHREINPVYGMPLSPRDWNCLWGTAWMLPSLWRRSQTHWRQSACVGWKLPERKNPDDPDWIFPLYVVLSAGYQHIATQRSARNDPWGTPTRRKECWWCHACSNSPSSLPAVWSPCWGQRTGTLHIIWVHARHIRQRS